MARYFADRHFASLSQEYAWSDKPDQIAIRKQALQQALKLHDRVLGKLMKENDIYPLWKSGNLPSVFWPCATNSYHVDSLSMSYGKAPTLLTDFARRTAAKKAELKIGQLQLGLCASNWSIGFHMEAGAWAERANLVAKLSGSVERGTWLSLLESFLHAGYSLEIGFEGNSSPKIDAEKFTHELVNRVNDKDSISMALVLRLPLGHKANDVLEIEGFAKTEFARLVPAYHFAAWSPANHYLKTL